MTAQVISLAIQPGIQRDGTRLDAPLYVDGQWVRFQRGRPRKIGGYKAIFLNSPGISRGMVMQSQQGINYVYSGYSNSVQYWQTDNDDGVGSGPEPITLDTNYFVSNTNNLWQFDIGYDANGSGALNVIAHPGQNLSDIDNTVDTYVLAGSFPGGTLTAVGVFTAVGVLTGTSFVISSANYKINTNQLVTGGGLAAGTTVISSIVSGSTTTVTLSGSGSNGSHTLTFDNQISVSGGACMVYPYLFVYGNNGLIQNCAAGDFTNWVSADSNANNISGTKVVKGLPLRGGTTSPSGLFWSLDQLTRVSYNPTTVGSSTLYWRYDIISSQTSILSSNSPIEYDGIYYWIGVDRFLMYNGVVQEIPNNTNINYFFDNVNYVQRQKVWAAKIPRWGEIWWFFPSGSSTECNDAIIYNIRENTWYDAGQALGAQRSAGVFSEVFRFPIWAGNATNTLNQCTIWQHEVGTDQIYLTQVDAINSYFETNSIGWNTGGPGQKSLSGLNNWIRLERIEPDFNMNGQMSVTVLGKGYADDIDVASEPYYFDNTTLKIDMREQRREMRLRFTSNTFNGTYECGSNILSADIGDVRSTGNP